MKLVSHVRGAAYMPKPGWSCLASSRAVIFWVDSDRLGRETVTHTNPMNFRLNRATASYTHHQNHFLVSSVLRPPALWNPPSTNSSRVWNSSCRTETSTTWSGLIMPAAGETYINSQYLSYHIRRADHLCWGNKTEHVHTKPKNLVCLAGSV